MSFENVYSTLRTRIGAYYTDRKEMNDPYNPESGKTDDLDSGWGLRIGSLSVNEVFAGFTDGPKSYTREMELLLTNKYVNGRGVPTKRIEKENLLISDGQNLISYLKDLIKDCSLIDSINFISDNGIEFLNEGRHITLTYNIEVTYQE